MSEGDVNPKAGLLSASDILEAFSNCSLGDTLAKRLSGDLDHVTSTKDFSQASSEWLRCALSLMFFVCITALISHVLFK